MPELSLSSSLNPFDLVSMESMVRGVTFKTEPMRPWWVGRCQVVANAVDWIPGAEAAAVYNVCGILVAVAAWRNPARPGGIAWSSAELCAMEEPAQQAV